MEIFGIQPTENKRCLTLMLIKSVFNIRHLHHTLGFELDAVSIMASLTSPHLFGLNERDHAVDVIVYKVLFMWLSVANVVYHVVTEIGKVESRSNKL